MNELQRQLKAQEKAEVQQLKARIDKLEKEIQQYKIKAEVELDKESLERVRAEIYNVFQK